MVMCHCCFRINNACVTCQTASVQFRERCNLGMKNGLQRWMLMQVSLSLPVMQAAALPAVAIRANGPAVTAQVPESPFLLALQ